VNNLTIDVASGVTGFSGVILAESVTNGAITVRTNPQRLSRDDSFLFGRDLLVAPVLRDGAERRGLYLPKGAWFELEGGKRHTGTTSERIGVKHCQPWLVSEIDVLA
jgi:hypothetical protein